MRTQTIQGEEVPAGCAKVRTIIDGKTGETSSEVEPDDSIRAARLKAELDYPALVRRLATDESVEPDEIQRVVSASGKNLAILEIDVECHRLATKAARHRAIAKERGAAVAKAERQLGRQRDHLAEVHAIVANATGRARASVEAAERELSQAQTSAWEPEREAREIENRIKALRNPKPERKTHWSERLIPAGVDLQGRPYYAES